MSGTSSATSATQDFSSVMRSKSTPTTRPPTTAGNVTRFQAGTTALPAGISNVMTVMPPIVARLTNSNSRDGVSIATIRGTASVRTTIISHAANASSRKLDHCTGSNTRDGRPTSPTPTTASARNAPKQRRKRNESEENPYGHDHQMAPSRIQP